MSQDVRGSCFWGDTFDSCCNPGYAWNADAPPSSVCDAVFWFCGECPGDVFQAHGVNCPWAAEFHQCCDSNYAWNTNAPSAGVCSAVWSVCGEC